MQLASSTKISFSQPLSPQLDCNQGNHSVVKTTNILKYIMAYGSTPYVGMTPKKNGGHIQSAQMTRSKCPR